MTAPPLLSCIAVAVDLRPGTRRLLAHGLRLSLDAGARMVVVHAGAAPGAHPWHVRPVLDQLCRAWGVTLPELIEVPAQGDDPAPAVVRAVEAHGPDLLVVGSQRRQGLERLLRGSTGERIARAFSVGTLVIGDDSPGLVDPDRGVRRLAQVLLPVGGALDPQDAVDAAAAFLTGVDARDAQVHLLQVAPNSQPAVQVQPPAWLKLAPRRREGTVVQGILAEAARVRADLIVMATRGHDSLADEVLGSRTERVLRQAPCPLLSVPLARD